MGGEKAKMNKRILGLVLAFVFLAMLAAPLVSAKPTSAANNPKSVSFMWHSENGAGTAVEGYPKINPPWAEIVDPGPPPVIPDAKVTHGRSVWSLNDMFSNYVQIGEGPQIPIDVDTGYEGKLYVINSITDPGVGSLNYRVYEKIMWEDDNYIEIMCLERGTYDLTGPIPEFYASGTFSGHGVVDGQKVQVTGIREGSFAPIGFVLECCGTIRFAGKA